MGRPTVCDVFLDLDVWLEEQGLGLHGKDDDGRTPVHLAAAKANLNVVRWIRRPLHLTAGGGRLEVVGWVQEQGVSVEAKSSTGKTARHLA